MNLQCVLYRMLTFVTRFKELLKRYPLIDVRAMGFPENWENEGIWDEKKQGNGSL